MRQALERVNLFVLVQEQLPEALNATLTNAYEDREENMVFHARTRAKKIFKGCSRRSLPSWKDCRSRRTRRRCLACPLPSAMCSESDHPDN